MVMHRVVAACALGVLLVASVAAPVAAAPTKVTSGPPDVTDEFGHLVLKMLEKKREDRPKSLHEVLMELRKVKVFKSVKEDEDMDGGGMM